MMLCCCVVKFGCTFNFLCNTAVMLAVTAELAWVLTNNKLTSSNDLLFVSLVYCAKSTVRWFVMREKHCWMAADSADKSKRTGRKQIN
jgi:hypothetical protein